MRVKIISSAKRDQFGMMSDLNVGDYLAVDDSVAQAMVDAGVADYDFSHLKANTASAPTPKEVKLVEKSMPVETVQPEVPVQIESSVEPVIPDPATEVPVGPVQSETIVPEGITTQPETPPVEPTKTEEVVNNG